MKKLLAVLVLSGIAFAQATFKITIPAAQQATIIKQLLLPEGAKVSYTPIAKTNTVQVTVTANPNNIPVQFIQINLANQVSRALGKIK